MKAARILLIGCELLKMMSICDLRIDDYKYLELYSAYYLYHMTLADYPESLPTDKHRANYVEETLCDPDGEPRNVLDCFVTKMCNAGVPIYWERFL